MMLSPLQKRSQSPGACTSVGQHFLRHAWLDLDLVGGTSPALAGSAGIGTAAGNASSGT
jgi:hypothetical protein